MGAAIGWVRKDKVQAKRSAAGGAIGGGLSGIIESTILAISYTDVGLAIATFVGLVLTGALIGLCMQLVQEALKTTWLIGVSTGPYEGKQYLLNGDSVSVGASELHDISLYRNSELRVPTGALVQQGGSWRWKGEPAEINGLLQTDAPIGSGDSIKLGNTVFRFRTKSGDQVSPASAAATAGMAAAPVTPPPSPVPVVQPVPPPPAPLAAPLPSAAPPMVPSPTAAPPVVPQPPQIVAKNGWQLSGIAGAIALPAPPGRATLGRAASNDIVLTDDSISSSHALLETYPYALKITDLQSTNGVIVNGVRMPAGAPAILHDGDTVQLGSESFRVTRTA